MAHYHIRRLSRLQMITARNMHQAQRETAHATLHSECDVTALGEAASAEGLPSPVSLHVISALLASLKAHPGLNAHLVTDELCVYDRIKLGLMLHTGQGVMMACISDAGAKSLAELGAALRDLHARAPTGRFELSETRGATFLVADLSAFPVDAFTPILMPSAVAILGIGRVRPGCRPGGAGLRPAHLLTLSLTFDHRATDGFAAGRFLHTLTRHLEAENAA